MTERLKGASAVPRAVDLLRNGGTVAFPTETVYGLGANALDASAVAKIFAAKERPQWDPLIVHVCDRAMLKRVADVPASLAARVDAVTADRSRVGVRIPRHPIALALIREAGFPIAAPSANRFGRTSPTTAAHVLEDLDGRIDAVLDGGATEVGLESTVLDVSEYPMVLYRPGAVTVERIAAVAGEVRIYRPSGVENADPPESLPSPGIGIRHYAPRARLDLVRDRAEMQQRITERAKLGERIGVMLPQGWRIAGAFMSYAWGPWDDHEVLARRLFAGLRQLDASGVDAIVCPMPSGGGGIDRAILDRLTKAAHT